MRKGFIFSLDSFFALILFVFIVFLIYIFSVSYFGLNQQYFFSEDLLTTLSETEITGLDLNYYPQINQLILDKKIKDADVTLVEQIVTFQLEGDQDSAEKIIDDIVKNIRDPNLKTAIYIGGTNIYSSDVLSGYEKNIISRTRLELGKS